MSYPIHVNLLLKSEQRSPAPVRAKVMVPAFALLFFGAFLVWSFYIRSRTEVYASREASVNNEIERKTPAHREYLDLKAATSDTEAGLEQLGYFSNARIAWAEALEALARATPDTVQFTQINHSYPPQPSASPLAPLPAPTNRVEKGTVLLRGRMSHTAGVAELLEELKKEPFTELFSEVEVPPGAVKQEPRLDETAMETMLFDIRIEVDPRRFE